MKLLRGCRIEDVANLLERRKRICVEHLRPHIAVIGRGVTAPCKYVLEVDGPVTHDDLGRHADARERRLFEGGDVEGLVGPALKMDLEIDEGRGDVFHGCLTLIEGARRNKPPQLVLRYRLAGAVVPGEAAQ